MHLRRTIALTVGALALVVPVLGSCGFNYPTDRVNDISNTGNDRSTAVAVVGAVIVSSAPGAGTFYATLANNGTETATFTGLGTTDAGSVTAASIKEIAIPSGSHVSLYGEDMGIRVMGADLGAGDIVAISVEFDSGESANVRVPVVTACGQYAGLDNAPIPSGSATDASSESPTASPYPCQEDLDEASPSSEAEPGE